MRIYHHVFEYLLGQFMSNWFTYRTDFDLRIPVAYYLQVSQAGVK